MAVSWVHVYGQSLLPLIETYGHFFIVQSIFVNEQCILCFCKIQWQLCREALIVLKISTTRHYGHYLLYVWSTVLIINFISSVFCYVFCRNKLLLCIHSSLCSSLPLSHLNTKPKTCVCCGTRLAGGDLRARLHSKETSIGTAEWRVQETRIRRLEAKPRV
jgi:hypothetical protein